MKYSTIIDVGSAEGHYSIGLATRYPHVRVYSYDVDPWARSQQRRLARMNGVNNVEIRGHCTSEELASRISDRTLLICDIEGHEYKLLDLEKTPALCNCDVLVEVHTHEGLGLTTKKGADELTRRFAASHKITRLSVLPRSTDAFDADLRDRLTREELASCVDEWRPQDQFWLWLEAHALRGSPASR